MKIHAIEVEGSVIDSKSRCKHYHNDVDIVAIKFKCCKTYYACYFCHEEQANHKAEVWKREERCEKAILCGSCGSELTINDYIENIPTCPKCNADFNPHCKSHFHLYFEV